MFVTIYWGAVFSLDKSDESLRGCEQCHPLFDGGSDLMNAMAHSGDIELFAGN